MRGPNRTNTVLALALTAVVAAMAACGTPAAQAPTPTPAARGTPQSRMPPSQKQWIMVDLPPGATQLQYGAQVYQLVCQDCHGDRGQGLTPQWRATWAPQDQNCWQSKCHAANHPPDGFIMPIAPAIAGAGTLSDLSTALQLHDRIQAEMPWYNPGSLTAKDAWSVTAWILHMNQIDPGADLNADTAAKISLH